MRFARRIALALPVCLLATLTLAAEPSQPPSSPEKTTQPMPASSPASPADTGASGSTASGLLLTIILRHDQSKPLTETKQELRRQGFFDNFPPLGTEVVSWYVVMGIGQIVTLRVPPDKLPDVNMAVEKGAWGSFHTEFYPTYDYREAAKGEYKSLK